MLRLQLKGTTGRVQVLNSNGQVVERRGVNLSEGSAIDFNLPTKAKGLYLVRVVSEKGVQMTKVLLQ